MTKPKFTFGDKIRRKAGGPMRTIRDIGQTAYYFEDGTFALRDDEDCYALVKQHSGCFLVDSDLDRAPMDRYVEHGYESRQDFRDALRKIIDYWGGRIGQRVGDRHGFLRLKFRDIPGGGEEAWIPLYLTRPVPMPDYLKERERDPIEEELDRAFGFIR